MNWYKKAQQEEDYRAPHSAPDIEDNAPLYDLTQNGVYPDDVYSMDGPRLYAHGEPYDAESFSIIHAAHNRPNYAVQIFRAVPDANKELKKQIKTLTDIIGYRNKFPFFPINNPIIDQLRQKYPVNDNRTYDEQQKLILEDIQSQIVALESQKKKPLTINPGDWVTICRRYAKEHGEANLQSGYSILSKTVKAKDLYTGGDSIHEWGYHPS